MACLVGHANQGNRSRRGQREGGVWGEGAAALPCACSMLPSGDVRIGPGREQGTASWPLWFASISRRSVQWSRSGAVCTWGAAAGRGPPMCKDQDPAACAPPSRPRAAGQHQITPWACPVPRRSPRAGQLAARQTACAKSLATTSRRPEAAAWSWKCLRASRSWTAAWAPSLPQTFWRAIPATKRSVGSRVQRVGTARARLRAGCAVPPPGHSPPPERPSNERGPCLSCGLGRAGRARARAGAPAGGAGGAHLPPLRTRCSAQGTPRCLRKAAMCNSR